MIATDDSEVTASPGPYVAAVGAALVTFVYLITWARRDGLDLAVYRDSVRSWESGYNLYAQTFTIHRLSFTYPPFALVALAPIDWLPFSVTQWLIWVADVAVATVSVLLVLRDRGAAITQRAWCGAFAWSCISVLVLEPARSGVDYGQIEFILMFVVVADLLAVPSRYRGILVGISAAVKLTPLVFILFLAVGGDKKSVLRATASFFACTGLSWFFWPRLSNIYWFHDLSHPTRIGSITYAGNQSWYAIMHRPPFPAAGSVSAWLLLSIATVAVSGFVAWRCLNLGERAPGMVAVGLGGLMISPISWTHHWIWVVLIPPMILRRAHVVVPVPVQALLWALVALTVVAPYWWFSSGIPADIFDAILPVWTAVVLVAWAVTEFVAWRAGDSRSIEGPVYSGAPPA